ncbi:hypothetical protein EOM39_06175 [Candidatus Gracilibacteria bacterium]|nr:hypothetical protein [Candidatus Gracilibacteria bacterium]
MEETNLHKKTINNAVAAYLLIFLSSGFLLNKTNPYINNDFVRGHTKTAAILHLMLLFIFIVFIRLINGYYIKTYVSSVLFLGVFGLMLYGIYKANRGEEYKFIDIVKMSKTEKVADLHKHIENDEQNKFSFFLSYIPFLSYANYHLLDSNSTYNKVFKNNIYINCIVSLIISVIYIGGNPNLALFILLFYIILLVFITVILVAQDNFIFVYIRNLEKLEYVELYLKTYLEYFKNYTKTKFTPIKELTKTNYEKEISSNRQNEGYLNTLKDSKLTNKLIYIPIINLIYLFSLDTKYRFHIINGLSLTIITIVMLSIYRRVDEVFFLLLYPVCFGIGNIRGSLAYKQTFIFHIYNSLILITNKISSIKKKVKETKNTVKKTDFKIEGEIEAGGKKIIEEVKEGSIVEKKEEVKVEK